MGGRARVRHTRLGAIAEGIGGNDIRRERVWERDFSAEVASGERLRKVASLRRPLAALEMRSAGRREGFFSHFWMAYCGSSEVAEGHAACVRGQSPSGGPQSRSA